MSKLDYTIKLVYPDWVIDELRDKRMGFSGKYKNFNFPVGAKMLVYLTEQQLIMGINTVKEHGKMVKLSHLLRVILSNFLL